MIEGSCHCGAVTFRYAATPDWLTRCTCSVCRRTGALWMYAPRSMITIENRGTELHRYSWGDRTMAFCGCPICGCLTHWDSFEPGDDVRMAVNARMADPKTIAPFRIRTFDGAESWTYLD